VKNDVDVYYENGEDEI